MVLHLPGLAASDVLKAYGNGIDPSNQEVSRMLKKSEDLTMGSLNYRVSRCFGKNLTYLSKIG